MFTRHDGLKMAVDMLAEIGGAADADKYALGGDLSPDGKQENILFRYVHALSKDPANIDALEGFCAVLTDKIALGADVETYDGLTD
ncbi:MAG: hypothetical protein V4570_00170 [Pseudomonadota bacterium]